MSAVVEPAINKKLLTAEEYFLIPDPPGRRIELVRGEIVEMSNPGFRHGKRQLRLARIVEDHVEANRLGHVVTETGFVTERGPDTVRGPDVAFWSASKVPLDEEPIGYPTSAADWVGEILSPSNRPGKMLEKVAEYFRAGVRMVWLIDPEDRVCWVYTSPDRAVFLHESATLDGGDVLPGFSCPVADLFGSEKPA